MTKTPAGKSKATVPLSIISKLAGGKVPLLPGEFEEEYREGLKATIIELAAQTPLQMYLAEKIFDCMWWIRRLEAQKTEAILSKMWELIKGRVQPMPDRNLIIDGQWTDPDLIAAVAVLGHTVESLLAAATKSEGAFIQSIDARIADRIRAMQGLQSSFEALVNRKLVIERLKLQNETLKRNLGAIDVKPISHGDE